MRWIEKHAAMKWKSRKVKKYNILDDYFIVGGMLPRHRAGICTQFMTAYDFPL